ncbi:MAG TPA: hypothetical protein VFQ60_04790, partial [Patescibacteria group bacterium]|nr:hypothetical protein [Patescibacteria group bacterium]
LTDKFLFSESYFHFKIYPLSQLHWAYKKVIKKSVNFIPTGKDYGLVMHFRPNITAEARESEDKVHKHLMLIAALYPAVKIGYTK